MDVDKRRGGRSGLDLALPCQRAADWSGDETTYGLSGGIQSEVRLEIIVTQGVKVIIKGICD